MQHAEQIAEVLKAFPDSPNRTLAKILHREHPKLFASIEAARSALRYARGASGAFNRQNMADKRFLLPKSTAANPLSLPDSDAETYPPYVVSPLLSRGLLLYDLHVPYHVPAAIETALHAARDFRVDHVIFPGDFQDYYQLSDFDKDPEARNLNGELTLTRQLFAAVMKALKDPKLIVSEGNHEARYTRRLTRAAPQLLGCSEFRLDRLLGLRAFDADWVQDKRIMQEGKLSVFHGHEFGKYGLGGVNPARTLYLRTKSSAVAGHSHQHSMYQARSVHDAVATCWTVGCLCELRPRFQPVNEWCHGFALVEKDKSGEFVMHNKRIVAGRIG